MCKLMPQRNMQKRGWESPPSIVIEEEERYSLGQAPLEKHCQIAGHPSTNVHPA